jgi:FtsH-binding integral membrane protein
MTDSTRIAALRYSLIATGLIFILGIYTLSQIWPSGWSWGVGHSHYWPMILAVYATLGVFLIRASRDPLANASLIWFTVWSSVAHALVMAAMGITDPAERGHLVGDVPALLLVAGALAILTRGATTQTNVTDLGVRHRVA